MKKRVAVWGTGNVGRPAIRAVLAHRDLELVAVAPGLAAYSWRPTNAKLILPIQ